MPSVREIVAAEKTRIIFTIVAENQFKRDLLADWEAASGSSGNTVHGKMRIDNQAIDNGYRGPSDVNHLMFDTLGFDYDEIDDIDRAKGVREMYLGLKTDWDFERSNYGEEHVCTNSSWSSCTSQPAITASINGDKDIFTDTLASINSTYNDVTELVINSSRTATAESESYDDALAQAKALSVPQPNGRAEGFESITCSNGVQMLSSDGRLVIDSMNIDNHLDDASATVSPVYEYNASHTSKREWSYAGDGSIIYTYTVTVKTLYTETRTYPPNTKLFDPEGYYLEIANNWNAITGIESSVDDNCYTGDCYINVYEYRAVYTRAVFYLETNVDWLIRHGDYYDIDKVKFLQASPEEIMYVLQLSINMWINYDKGFWGSTFGRILKVVIFTGSFIIIAMSFGTLTEIFGTILGALFHGIMVYGIAYGVGRVTGDALLAKAILMSGALITFGNTAFDIDTTIQMVGGSLKVNYYATFSFSSALNLVSNIYSLRPKDYELPLMEEQYTETLDTEEEMTALMYGDNMEDMMYYDYNQDIAFKDVYQDYARMA